MDQPFYQQNVLAADIRLVAEKDLHNLGGRVSRLRAVLRFDELADYRDFQRPHQIGHEHERILKDGKRLNRLPLVVVGDVARKLLNTFLNVFGRNNLANGLWSQRIHEAASSSE